MEKDLVGRFSVGKLPGILHDSSEKNEKTKFTFWNNIEQGHVFTVSQQFLTVYNRR